MAVPWLPLGLVICGFVAYKVFKIGQRPAGYPPGPPTLPLIGNLHQMPLARRHLQFQKWAQEYGPVYSLIVGSRVVVVLSSDEVVKDLLDRRGGIYSSRPHSYITNITSGGMIFALMPYNDTWKMIHRLFASILNMRAAQSYIPYQDLENKQLINSLLEAPKFFKTHIRRYSYSVSTQIIFGFRTADTTDARFVGLFQAIERWSELIGRSLALLPDIYPAFKYLPDIFLPVRPYALSLHHKHLKLFRSIWKDTTENINNGVAPPCFAKDMVKAQAVEGFDDDLASYICCILLAAGSDTTSSELRAFIQAMILFPEVQKRAQEELDRVCGGRYPTREDAESLPYVRACVKELCRWMPTAILGIPHAVTRDDEYMGYKIPKDATVICNVWAIHMDAARHPNPRAFDPTRYLGDNRSARESLLSSNVKERDHFLFGAGRRSCMGIDLAETSLYIGVARMLWAFNISKGEGPDGKLVAPDPEDIAGGLMAGPADFYVTIEARTEKHAQTVRDEWAEAQTMLDPVDKQWKLEHFPSDLKFGQYGQKLKPAVAG